MLNERNLKLINFFAFFSSAWFFIPVLLNFCKDEIGVGYQGMIMSEAAFAAVCVIFDVPTGWLSDIWRRKNSLALGAAINIVALAGLLMAHGIWALVLSQMAFGIGISLFNGTHTAMLYDSLLSLGREREYRQREGMRQASGLYGLAIAGTLGGFFYETNHYLPVLLSMSAYFVVFIVACFLHEPERHKRTTHRNPIVDIRLALRYVLHGHAEVGLVIFMAAILYCATKNIMWAQQPYYMAMHFTPAAQSSLMSIGWLLGGLSSHVAHRLDGRVNNFRSLLLALAIICLFSVGAGIFLGYQGPVFLILGGSCIYGIISPRVNEIINRNVDSSQRATILSTQTFLASLFFVPVSSMVGWITDRWSIQQGLIFIAGLALASALALLLWKRSTTLALLKDNKRMFTPHVP